MRNKVRIGFSHTCSHGVHTQQKKPTSAHCFSHEIFKYILKKQYDAHKNSWFNDLLSVEKIFQVFSGICLDPVLTDSFIQKECLSSQNRVHTYLIISHTTTN